jgi:hypothetical protein
MTSVKLPTIVLTITGFLDIVHRPLRRLDLFPSSGEGGKTPTLLGPLERANLKHWTLKPLEPAYDYV